MKNFIAGVLVTSALLLVGFQTKQVKPHLRYEVQLRQGKGAKNPRGGLVFTNNPYLIEAAMNRQAARGGRLVHIMRDPNNGPRDDYFVLVWEFQK